MTFRIYIKQKREALKMRKKDFALALGVNSETYKGWENYGATPSESKMKEVVLKIRQMEASK